jgi:2-polyprenyl-3-methyl-5-hydroxy-6-metoxy-1,4-benzoquinol methylase
MTKAVVEKQKSAEENLVIVESPDQVDQVNSSFYSRFPYPWKPQMFHFGTDPGLHTRLVNQNIGDWSNRAIPANAKIWVAGCGTNQAIYTALQFPDAEIIGSDLSPKSLEICMSTARDMQLKNLTLRQESINGAEYSNCFDLVICTGVVHHNAEPERSLRQLVRAMKPAAVLEFMVYNRFHRLLCSAFQKAVRLLVTGEDGVLHSEDELKTARSLMRSFATKNLIHNMLQRFRSASEAEFADALIQPVEHSYTVETYHELVSSCGLEMLSPTINEHDRSNGYYNWAIDFDDAGLQGMFDALPDLARWQFVNLLLLEQSPMLWFYCQRTDSGRRRLTQEEINQSFLDTVFMRVKSTRKYYLLQPSGHYTPAAKVVPFPGAPPHASVAKVYEGIDGRRTMREILSSKSPGFGSVLSCRTHLATTAFPYIVAAGKE